MLFDAIKARVLPVLMLTTCAWCHYTRNLKLDFLCSPLETGRPYVRDTPWDCSSYVICMDGTAIPTACPYYRLYARAGRNSKCEVARAVDATRCQGTVWQYISSICLYNPTARIPDASRCGQYFDCSHMVGHPELMDYLAECPYPQLFSKLSGQCEDYRFVTCGERKEPKAPCEYLQYMQMYDCRSANCPACKQRHPSCVGLSHGRQSVPKRQDVMVHCEGERTIRIIQSSIVPST